MDLSIDYECPECRKTFNHRLMELCPGDNRECSECGINTVLTPTSLKGLEVALKQFCSP